MLFGHTDLNQMAEVFPFSGRTGITYVLSSLYSAELQNNELKFLQKTYLGHTTASKPGAC